jgi:hypothetical protein
MNGGASQLSERCEHRSLLSRISLATRFGPLGPKLFLWGGFFTSHNHGSAFLIDNKRFSESPPPYRGWRYEGRDLAV